MLDMTEDRRDQDGRQMKTEQRIPAVGRIFVDLGRRMGGIGDVNSDKRGVPE
ncbi:hypothetical protein LQG66_02180 [Bradyrhizobium ontarionense]|uniref:Uncharacterized protein n=1 Tax=Bradyrhizobium ontarionense TaxID=2898149 RepID=A0ABY3RDI5_9BRAD|nr:hypothetical protein [Bradyrhizobium sp. A19]UFZ05153.1 hypothetical protein LQG66_02180 [Bradyrhizobium sp. A19]